MENSDRVTKVWSIWEKIPISLSICNSIFPWFCVPICTNIRSNNSIILHVTRNNVEQMFPKGGIEIYRERRKKKKREEKLTNFFHLFERVMKFYRKKERIGNANNNSNIRCSIRSLLLFLFFLFFFEQEKKRRETRIFCLDSRRIRGKISGWKSKKEGIDTPGGRAYNPNNRDNIRLENGSGFEWQRGKVDLHQPRFSSSHNFCRPIGKMNRYRIVFIVSKLLHRTI